MSPLVVVRSRQPPGPFDGVHLKIERAKADFAELRTAVHSWTQLAAYDCVPEIDHKARQQVLRFRVVTDPPPTWGLDAADIANNLRTALNYAVHAIAEPDSDELGFPIYRSKTDYWSPRPRAKRAVDRLSPREGYLAGVHDDYRAVIDRGQPYVRGAGADTHQLAQLAVLSNTDKHRTNHVSLAVPRMVNLEVIPLGDVDSLAVQFIAPDSPLYDGAEIARFSVRPLDREVAVKGRLAVAVAFGERRIPAPRLGAIGDYVVKVIERLEAIKAMRAT